MDIVDRLVPLEECLPPPTDSEGSLAVQMKPISNAINFHHDEVLNWDEQMSQNETVAVFSAIKSPAKPISLSLDFSHQDPQDNPQRKQQKQHRLKSDRKNFTSQNASTSSSGDEDDILQHINVSKILGEDDTPVEEITTNLTIPADKVGLVIGKGGKTIKNIQECSGVRMHVIQYKRENGYDENDKTLRIVGPPDLVRHATQLVSDLISSHNNYQNHYKQNSRSNYQRNDHDHRDNDRDPDHFSTSKRRPRYNRNYNGTDQNRSDDRDRDHDRNHHHHHDNQNQNRNSRSDNRFDKLRYTVPKLAVGLIIGKGGETIKRIRAETGAKVQFEFLDSSRGRSDVDEQEAVITGKQDQIRHACRLIEDLVELSQKTKVQDQRQGQTETFNSSSRRTPRDKDSFDAGAGSEVNTNNRTHDSKRLYPYRDRDNRYGQHNSEKNTGRDNFDSSNYPYSNSNSRIRKSNDYEQQERSVNKNGNDWRTKSNNSQRAYKNHNETEIRLKSHYKSESDYTDINTYNSGGTSQFADREKRISVPAGKVKLVVGKGKETLRLICKRSGARCEIELAKDGEESAQFDDQDRIFVLRGQPKQIQLAADLIMDRINGRSHTKNSTCTEQKNSNSSEYNSYLRGPSMREKYNETELGAEKPIADSEESAPTSTLNDGNHNSVSRRRAGPEPIASHSPRRNQNYDAVNVNIEWGQGDPSVPLSLNASIDEVSHQSNRVQNQVQYEDYRNQNHNNNNTPSPSPNFNSQQASDYWHDYDYDNYHSNANDQGYSQWLEYFHPERQQAQADAWDQQVKAEQDCTCTSKQEQNEFPSQCLSQSTLDLQVQGIMNSNSTSKCSKQPEPTPEEASLESQVQVGGTTVQSAVKIESLALPSPSEEISKKSEDYEPGNDESNTDAPNENGEHQDPNNKVALHNLESEPNLNSKHKPLEISTINIVENEIDEQSSLKYTAKNVVIEQILKPEPEGCSSTTNVDYKSISSTENMTNNFNTVDQNQVPHPEIASTASASTTTYNATENSNCYSYNYGPTTNLQYPPELQQAQQQLGYTNSNSFAPSIRVATVYYDLNNNSIVVINQWHYT